MAETATKTALQRMDTLKDLLEKAAPKLQEVAPKHLKPERLVRLLLAACSRNPKILECSPDSILQFAMKCSETGLEPIGAGGMWAIPFDNKKAKKMELQAIPDYRGLVNCAKQSGCVKDAFAEVVFERDDFEYELGEQPKIVRHKPARGDRGAPQLAYCVLVMPDDTRRPVFMDGSEIEAIRDRSPAWRAWLAYKKACPWNTDAKEMWKKTVVRRACKMFAGASVHFDSAVELDNQADGIELQVAPAPVPMPKAIGEGETNVALEQAAAREPGQEG